MRNGYEVLNLVVWRGKCKSCRGSSYALPTKKCSASTAGCLDHENIGFVATSTFQTLMRHCTYLHSKRNYSLFGKENNKLNFLKHITGRTSFHVICEELSTDTQRTKYNSKVMSSVIN